MQGEEGPSGDEGMPDVGSSLGVQCTGLLLLLVFELRTDVEGDKKGKARDEAHEVNLLRRFFSGLSHHLSRSPPDDSTFAASPPSSPSSPLPLSFFSPSPSVLPAFLCYLLDRLILSIPLIHDGQHGVDDELSPRVVLVREVLTFLLSASPIASFEAPLAHLLSHHLPEPTNAFSFLLPYLVPSTSSHTPRLPLTSTVRSLHLLTAWMKSFPAWSSVPLLVPTLLAASTSWSRAVRHAALLALFTWKATTDGDKKVTSNQVSCVPHPHCPSSLPPSPPLFFRVMSTAPSTIYSTFP